MNSLECKYLARYIKNYNKQYGRFENIDQIREFYFDNLIIFATEDEINNVRFEVILKELQNYYKVKDELIGFGFKEINTNVFMHPESENKLEIKYMCFGEIYQIGLYIFDKYYGNMKTALEKYFFRTEKIKRKNCTVELARTFLNGKVEYFVRRILYQNAKLDEEGKCIVKDYFENKEIESILLDKIEDLIN